MVGRLESEPSQNQNWPNTYPTLSFTKNIEMGFSVRVLLNTSSDRRELELQKLFIAQTGCPITLEMKWLNCSTPRICWVLFFYQLHMKCHCLASLWSLRQKISPILKAQVQRMQRIILPTYKLSAPTKKTRIKQLEKRKAINRAKLFKMAHRMQIFKELDNEVENIRLKINK